MPVYDLPAHTSILHQCVLSTNGRVSPLGFRRRVEFAFTEGIIWGRESGCSAYTGYRAFCAVNMRVFSFFLGIFRHKLGITLPTYRPRTTLDRIVRDSYLLWPQHRLYNDGYPNQSAIAIHRHTAECAQPRIANLAAASTAISVCGRGSVDGVIDGFGSCHVVIRRAEASFYQGA